MENTEFKTEEELLDKLAQEALDGHLLLFIGTGFSKSVVPLGSWSLEPTVPSWTELLRTLCERMDLKPDDYILPDKSKYGLSHFDEAPAVWNDLPNIDYACPAIAARICDDWERKHPDMKKSGSFLMKEIIASLSVWVPLKTMRNRVCGLLEAINPVGIVTTNYDMVIEAILADKGQYLGRDDLFRVRNDGKMPIWHIHGSLMQPETIVITSEDYQTFFRPDNYAQRKISMLLHEYTTVFVGYSLGDPNIATAIDWAMHVFKSEKDVKNGVVQIRLIHSENEGSVSQDKSTSSMYYLETEDAVVFLEKLQQAVLLEKKRRQKSDERFSKLSEIFSNLSETNNTIHAASCNDFVNIVKSVKNAVRKNDNINIFYRLMPYLQSCISNARERAKEDGNFKAYADWLFILLEMLKDISFKEMPPALFALLGEELESVLSQTGNEFGKSYSANDLWHKEACHISPQLRDAFLEYAERLQLRNLAAKLKSLPPPLIVKD